MQPATRTHRDAALVVLATIGGAAWLSLPVSLAMKHSGEGTLVAVVLGCALAVAAVVTVMPRLAPATAGVGGAVAALLMDGMLSLWELAPREVTWATLDRAGLAAIAAAAAAWLMRRRPWGPRHLTVSSLVSFGMTATLWVLGTTAAVLVDGGATLGVLVVLLAPVGGGVAVGVLVRDGTSGDVALGWPLLLGSMALGAAFAEGSPLMLGPGLLSVLILGPFLAGLGAIGVWLARRWAPRAPVDLPPARALS